jgi:hypothetical protein
VCAKAASCAPIKSEAEAPACPIPAAPPPLALAAARAEPCAAAGVKYRRPPRVSLRWSANWSKPRPLGVFPCCTGAISPISIDGGPPERHRHLTTAGRPSPQPPPDSGRSSMSLPSVSVPSSFPCPPLPVPRLTRATGRPELRRFGAGWCPCPPARGRR